MAFLASVPNWLATGIAVSGVFPVAWVALNWLTRDYVPDPGSWTMTLLLAFLIGFLTGLRALTPAAAVAWAGFMGWLTLRGWLEDMGTLLAVVIWTVLALAELAADKSSRIGNRTGFQGLSARIFMGALTGACMASAGGESLALGAGLGSLGGIAGAFAGFHARRSLVQASGKPDTHIALLEDLVAIGGSAWVVTRFI